MVPPKDDSMSGVPQPSSDPYSVGDRVRVYVGSDDPDSRYHDSVCKVVEVLEDDLGVETGRDTDGYSYILRDVENERELPVSFRHRDLVPVDRP